MYDFVITKFTAKYSRLPTLTEVGDFYDFEKGNTIKVKNIFLCENSRTDLSGQLSVYTV